MKALVLLLAASIADDDVLLRQLNSSFRPFKANNTEAYAYADWVGSQIAPRDATMTDAACRERVVAAAKGIEWNSVGCSFPASWRYDSAAFSTLKNCTLLGGSPYQRATEEIILKHDHLREDVTHGDSGNELLQKIKSDGFATIDDWGLSPAFIDALASEAFAKLDDAARISKNKAVVSTNAILETLETTQGKLFWQNSSLLSAAVRYLGPDAELAGYEALRLTNELTSESQSVWKSNFYGAFVLNRRVDLHAIDAPPARWRGDAGSSSLDGLISTQVAVPLGPVASRPLRRAAQGVSVPARREHKWLKADAGGARLAQYLILVVPRHGREPL